VTRVAFVTGGNTGIGAATCERLAADDLAVAIAFHEAPDDAASLADRVPGRAIAVACDVREPASVAEAVAEATSALGPPTVLVNNAAVLDRVPIDELDAATWDRAIDVALSGAFRCVRSVLPGMLEAGGGSIVNVTSELVNLGGDSTSAYVAAKAGLVGLTRTLARELGPRGVRVNAVAPGPTDTRMVDRAAIAPSFLATIPLGRIGDPADVAAAISFLAGDAASYVTGQVLGVNGGLVMG
jgi:NAD(P)-dependent dehydrogenase (short-subunit alcohol dehydrogenase family)